VLLTNQLENLIFIACTLTFIMRLFIAIIPRRFRLFTLITSSLHFAHFDRPHSSHFKPEALSRVCEQLSHRNFKITRRQSGNKSPVEGKKL
jgi:hypothetical protein